MNQDYEILKETAITVKNLNYGFTRKEIYNGFSNLSLLIPKGEKVAIIGPSGAGKSTLLYLIAGYPIEHKEIFLDDMSSNLRANSLYSSKAIFYLSTLKSNLTFDYTLDKKYNGVDQIDKNQFKTYIDDQLNQLIKLFSLKIDLDRSLSSHADQISSGQKQRASIIRFLLLDMVNPKPIFLFDEPTSDLNTKLKNNFYEFMIKEYKHKTILCVLHDIDYLKYFDRFLILDHFNIVFDCQGYPCTLR